MATQLIDQFAKDLRPDTKAAVYESIRLNAIMALILSEGVVARASRDGLLEFVELPTTVSKQVTLAAGEWVAAVMELDRDGIYNVVVTTNDQADSRITGMARELYGPLSARSPLKPRIWRHSSPWYTTKARANAGAAKRLAALIAERSLPVKAWLPFDPTVDVGDLHTLSLVPGSLEPDARVMQVRWSLGDADMEITYSVPRSEVEAWTRPSDLQPN